MYMKVKAILSNVYELPLFNAYVEWYSTYSLCGALCAVSTTVTKTNTCIFNNSGW